MESDIYDGAGIECWADPALTGDLIYQEITLPNGTYKLEALALARVDLGTSATKHVSLFAGDKKVEINTTIWGKYEIDGIEVTDQKLRIGITADAENDSKWQALSQVRLYMNSISEGGDLTVLVNNPNFDGNTMTGWSGNTVDANFAGGNINAYSGTPEVYNKVFDIYQTISVPNGVYRVSAQAKTNTDNNLYVYASTFNGETSITKETVVNNATSDLGIKENLNLKNISDKFKEDLDANRFATDYIAVTDGEITVGIKWPTYVAKSWAVFDAFRLTYGGATLLEALKNEYKNLCDELNTLAGAEGYPTAFVKYAQQEASASAEDETDEGVVRGLIEHINKIMALFNDNAKKVAALQTELEGWLDVQSDEDLRSALTEADTDMANDAANMETIYNNLIKAQKTYAGKYSKQYVVERFDLNDGKLDGWTKISSGHPSFINNSVAECWNRNVDIYRGLTDMPSGHYRLTVNAFIGQGGQTSEQYDQKLLSSNFVIFGDNSATGYRYSVPVLWRYDEVPVVDGVTMGEEEPSNPAQANAAFGAGYYVNTLDFYFDGNGSLNYGIAGTNNKSKSTWLCFDNFELTYMGNDLSALWDDMRDAAATRAAKVSDNYKAVFQSKVKPAEVTKADIIALSDLSKEIMEVANKVAEIGNKLNDNSVIPSSLTTISTAKYDDVTALNNAYTEAHNKRKSTVTSIADADAIYTAYVTTARQEYMKAANPTGENTFDMDFLLTNPSTYAWKVNAFTKDGSDGNGYYSDMICKIGQKDYVHNFGLQRNSGKKGSVTPEVWEFVESWTDMPGGFKQKDGNGWVIYQQTALPEGAYKFKAATFGDAKDKAHIAVGQGDAATDKGDAVTSDGLEWTEVNFSIATATTEENPTKLGIFIEDDNACNWFGVQYLHLYKVAPATAVDLNEEYTSLGYTEDMNANITLTRTLKADKWNTFCVPFDMNDVQLSANKITEVRKLTSAKEGNVLTFDKVSTVKAGVPYIVKVSEGVGTITVNNTTIKAAAPSAIEVNYDVAEVSTCNKVAMTGNYTRQYVPKDAYFISNNMFYLADEADAVTLKGFRAYITVTEGTAVGTEANCFFIDIDGVVTAASEVLADKEALQDVVDVYTMTGVKVRSNVQRADALNGLAKGLYIVGGKTVINNE